MRTVEHLCSEPSRFSGRHLPTAHTSRSPPITRGARADMEELDEAGLAMELAEQRILCATEAEVESLGQREMTVEVDQEEEA